MIHLYCGPLEEEENKYPLHATMPVELKSYLQSFCIIIIFDYTFQFLHLPTKLSFIQNPSGSADVSACMEKVAGYFFLLLWPGYEANG